MASLGGAPVHLILSESADAPGQAAPWIGPLVALGGLAWRYRKKLTGQQLIVAISVPHRDFAAALIGCGWAMNSAAPKLRDPLEEFRELQVDTPVRIVTEREVIADHFRALNESTRPPRVRLTGSQWVVSRIKAVAPLAALDAPARIPRPNPGGVARIARLDRTWDARLAAPAADLAIVGTLKWLHDDVAALLTREGEPGNGATIADLLLPKGRKTATWFTRLLASARFSDQLPLPSDIRAAILDGAGAIKYVAEVETPVVICILDRSVADETAAEIVIQLRNSRGEPLSLSEDLGWRPPTGIEALAFTVAL